MKTTAADSHIKVSIIIPIGRKEQFLSDCIASLKKQTFEAYEVIMVLDGAQASDKVYQEAFSACRDPRFSCCPIAAGGVTRARKTGLRKTRAQYICFLDSDDWIDSEYLETMVKAAESTGADLVIGSHIQHHGKIQKHCIQALAPGLYTNQEIQTDILHRVLFSGGTAFRLLTPSLWGKLFVRELLEPALLQTPDTLQLCEDLACTYSCIVRAQYLVVLDTPAMYHYRRHTASQTAAFKPAFWQQAQLCCQVMHTAYTGHPEEAALLRQLDDNLLYFAIHAILNEQLAPADERSVHKLATDILADEGVQKALCKRRWSDFFFTYRLFARLLEKKQLRSMLLLAKLYPLLAALKGEVF